MVEFSDVKKGRSYTLNSQGIVLHNNSRDKEGIIIPKDAVLDLLTACVDYAKRYGLDDNYDRPLNLETLFSVMLESK